MLESKVAQFFQKLPKIGTTVFAKNFAIQSRSKSHYIFGLLLMPKTFQKVANLVTLQSKADASKLYCRAPLPLHN